jgi:hypothetical protein
VTATGWTFEMVDALPFPKVLELFEYWADCPPEHLLLKIHTGYKGARKRKELNAHERAALPSPNAQLPPPPAYVIAAMNRQKAEAAHARR